MKHLNLHFLLLLTIPFTMFPKDEALEINFEDIGEGEDDVEFSLFNMSQPNYEKYFLIGTKAFKAGDVDKAIENYLLAIKANGNSPQPYFNLGLTYEEKNFTDKAIEAYSNALSLKPEYPKAHMQLAKLLQQKEKIDEALIHYEQAIKFDKKLSHLAITTARLLCEKERFKDAIPYFEIAVDQKPDDVIVRFEYANALNTSGFTKEALKQYLLLLKKRPNDSGILYNTAYTFKKLGQLDDAMPYYQAALKRKPNHAEAHFSLGLAHLIAGDFLKGWPEYEWRWQRGSQLAPRDLKQPLWDGSSLKGKTILHHAEQGLGDTFQFIRYVKMIKEQFGGKVILAVQRPLFSFAARCCPYADKVISLGEIFSTQCDVQSPLMSLPMILKTDQENIPTDIPYLHPDPILVNYWRKKLASDSNFKVGICWQGNSKYSTPFLRAVVAAKSIPLNKFAPFGDLSNVSFYSLQKETGTDQLKNIPQGLDLKILDDLDTKHGRFMDTAAVIKNLDLVITIDTSIGHLAGALGKPVWVLVPEPPDWRWMIKRTDSPWYPTNMKLYRQPTAGDWDSVIQNVKNELNELVNNSGKPSVTFTTKSLDTPKATRSTPTMLSRNNLVTENKVVTSCSNQLENELVDVNKKLLFLSKRIQSMNGSPDNQEFIEAMRKFYLLTEIRAQLRDKLAALA